MSDLTLATAAENAELLKNKMLLRQAVAKAMCAYCNKCGDSGNGCADCRVYDFGLFHGINDPL